MKIKKILTSLAAISALTMPLVFVGAAQALSVKWDPAGTYTIRFSCTAGCSGDYDHTMNISNFHKNNGNFAGNGNYIPDPSYTWNLNGNLNGSAMTWHILYTGTNPGYTVDGAGTVASNGTLSGTATSSSGQSFNWSSISGAATATGIKDFDANKNLRDSQCRVNKNSSEIVDVNFKLINDYDSGIGGNAWANDTIHRNLEIWKTGSTTFCAIVKDNGKIVTFAGESPNGSGQVGAGVKGVMDGGYITGQFTGSQISNPAYAKHGQLGTFDLQCVNAYTCPGAHPTVSSYVSGYAGQLSWWGWEYNTCQNGNWVNSSDGNFGDITGSAPAKDKCHLGDRDDD